MQIEEIKKILISDKKYMQNTFGLCSIAIFGSRVKGIIHSDSDVDFLIDLNKPDYLKYVGLQKFLEERLNMKVDLIRKGPHLSTSFLNSIEDDLTYA